MNSDLFLDLIIPFFDPEEGKDFKCLNKNIYNSIDTRTTFRQPHGVVKNEKYYNGRLVQTKENFGFGVEYISLNRNSEKETELLLFNYSRNENSSVDGKIRLYKKDDFPRVIHFEKINDTYHLIYDYSESWHECCMRLKNNKLKISWYSSYPDSRHNYKFKGGRLNRYKDTSCVMEKDIPTSRIRSMFAYELRFLEPSLKDIKKMFINETWKSLVF